VFFGALKKLKASARGEFEEDSVNDIITKLAQASEQTATWVTIHTSLLTAGKIADTSSRPFRLKVDEGTPWENEGFKEIWDRDFKIKELSEWKATWPTRLSIRC
jgi:hypothetical protein